ncbi:hypothetical protein LQZ18_03300 [Lachnospiraceae bacterium ZAX-1]
METPPFSMSLLLENPYFIRFSKHTVSTVLPKTNRTQDSYINIIMDFVNRIGRIPLNSIVEKAEACKPNQRIYNLQTDKGIYPRKI